ncbi:MAG TPA: hypothetical protein VLT47_10880 [Anaeromyxobacteraceae bacterium]|nr:hypothetical protein [Anaeromyxobacteraceae bacterium]
MSIKFTITSGQQIQPGNAANVVARVGVAANGDANGTIYQFSPGQDVNPSLVGGPLAEDCAFASTWSGAPHIGVKVQASTAGTISAVTKPNGSTSPTPTIAGSTFDGVTNSPFNAYNLALRYSGGQPGACSVDIALDAINGVGSFDYTYPMPPALPGTLRGSVDVTGFTWSKLDNLTLMWKLDSGSVLTVTFGGTVTGEADVLSAFTTQSIPASFVQVGDKRYLQVTASTLGSTGKLYFMGGSAEDLLGFVPSVAVDRGTIDVSTGFTWASLDNETLIYTPDGGTLITATMGASVTAEADVLSAFSSHPTVNAYFVRTATGKHYLEVAALTPGPTGALLRGAGTANTGLGMTATTPSAGSSSGIGTGVDSTITIPGTGLTGTFPFGTYLVETHTATTSAPRHSNADKDAALALLNARLDLSFGLVSIIQEAVDATDILSCANDADATAAAWEAQAAKRFVHFLVAQPSSLADSAVATSLVSESSRRVTVAARWAFVDAARGQPQGTFQRSNIRPLAMWLAAQPKYSDDVGYGGYGAIPGVHMIGPDGVTLAPNDDTATVKLGGSKGPGYAVLRGKASNGRADPYFVRGVTRAGPSSLFVDTGVCRMINRAAQIIFFMLQTQENLTLDLNPNGTIQEADAKSLETTWQNALKTALVDTGNASAATVAINRTEDISQTRNLTVNYTVQERGQGEDITATLTLTGTLTIS